MSQYWNFYGKNDQTGLSGTIVWFVEGKAVLCFRAWDMSGFIGGICEIMTIDSQEHPTCPSSQIRVFRAPETGTKKIHISAPDKKG